MLIFFNLSCWETDIPRLNNYKSFCVTDAYGRRRDTGEDAVKPAAGSQFSFLEFGSDDQGFYKTFKPKTKRYNICLWLNPA